MDTTCYAAHMPGIFSQETIAEVLGNRAEELTLDRALQLFQTVYMPSRNFAEKTRRSYKTDLAQLIAFLKSCGVNRLQDVGLANLRSFLADLDAKGLTGVTRRRKVAAIRALFGFLAKDGLISRNPTLELVPPEREYKEPRYLTKQEYEALLTAASHETRDTAIIELLLQTGIRLCEVARLTIHDIELPTRIDRDPANTGSIFIVGKGRKERTLPLNHKVCRALKAWLAVRPDIESPTLFVTSFQEPMGPRAIENMVAKYFKAAGIQGASVHTLRHTFGTHHAIKGTDLRTIQATLGHARLETTAIYVSMAKEAMKRQLQDHAL